MSRNIWSTAAVAAIGVGVAVGMGGCEEKKPQAGNQAPPSTSAPSSDLTKSVTDAANSAVGKGKEVAKEAVDKAKEAAAAITEKAQQAMKDYLGGLGDANAAMEKIKSVLDAPQGLSSLNEAAKKVNVNSTILGALPDAEKTAVKDANKSQLSELTAKFREQMDRLTKDSGIGKVVGDALKSFKLFE